MINFAQEELLTLKDAAKRLPGRPHTSALFRWSKGMADGRRLETLKIGGRVFTSLEALQRFIAGTGKEQPNESESHPRQQRDVDRELDAAGFN